ncbi:MAG TPA: hypothetical protein VGL06_02165, partial [Pseudonocardiaceae bacterium]
MSTSEVATSAADLAALLPDLMVRDERRLRRRLDGTRKIRDAKARQRAIDGIAADIETAQAGLRHRQEVVPKITYPAELPVSQRKDEIL